ncbi:MAG TPA: sigma-70 family RNA polymerase sigma factor [Vicinamibacterales bacterium]|nr:sigma-70 family RNA polymerase sigma factor [Vicinamibacterales bacterium]
MPDEVESDLLERFVHGDQAAFETLFRRFQSEVHRWIARIVRDAGTADDVLVEAFWRAYRARGRFDPSRSFGAWMRRIATNAALDAVRHARAARWRAIEDTLPAVGGPDPDVRDAIVAAFRRLPPKLQVAATLALVEEVPYAEIADALDIPIGTVKSRVSRATGLLRTELARRGVRP